MRMQFLLFLCRPHNSRILKHKKDHYSGNRSGRAYKQGNLAVKGLTNKVLKHVEATEGWRFTWLDGRFGSVNNSEGTESSSYWIFVCFLYAIVALLFILILQKLCFYMDAVLRFFMLISLFFPSSKKGDNSSNRMGGSVRSTFQEVQIIHSLNFRMLLLCYHYITDYAVFTRIILLQRSDIIWFSDYWSLRYPSKKDDDSRNMIS